MTKTPDDLILIALISSAHGIRGQVKIKSYTDPIKSLSNYKDAIQDKNGKKYPFKINGVAKNQLIATLENITDRNQSEALAGTELFIPRELLPKPKNDEFYYEDLKNLEVRNIAGAKIATVIAIDNYGAGDVIEIKNIKTKKAEMHSFDVKTFPEINISDGYIVIDTPEIIIHNEAESTEIEQ